MTDATTGEMRVQLTQARAALREIVGDLTPGPCDETTCDGCRAEWSEALTTARNALADLTGCRADTIAGGAA